MSLSQKSIALHKKNKGKLEIKSKVSLASREDLALAYTPGVGAVSMAIAKNKKLSYELTGRANRVAIISDGTAVLGLGDIGPEAAMPVMEGKAIIFKEFAGIDAFPLCVNTTSIEEIVNFCKYIEPSFGGINLEDISAPRCFDVLSRLEKELSIPVFHDDQDGTAIVVLAGLINACALLKKDIKKIKIVINGSGAAGSAIVKLLYHYGARNIIALDSQGIICLERGDLSLEKKALLKFARAGKKVGALADAMMGADCFIGVSRAGLLTKEMVASMNDNSIVFALANPTPEIMPAEALSAGAAIVGTGRSDFPNQINNALVFPGTFKGLLEGRIKKVTTKMKINAALAIAESVKPTKTNILPSIFDKKVVKKIAERIKR